MKIVKFLLSLAASGGLIYALSTSFNVKGAALPPLGKFLSPFHGFWQNADPVLPVHPDLTFTGLKDEVKIVYDDRDVPHVFAKNDADVHFAQGYLHAANRLWQMEMATRSIAGQLSEVLGDRPVSPGFTLKDVDKLARRRGFLQGAEKTLETWKEDAASFDILQSYCAGVNAFITAQGERGLPFEYKFFGVTPTEWTPLKCVLMHKYMAKDLAFRFSDIQATNAKNMLGQADFDFIFPEYFKEQTPIVPTATPFSFSPEAPKPALEKKDPLDASGFITPRRDSILTPKIPLEHLVDVPELETLTMPNADNGSNNWAVSGAKTASGKPILCGDPHLNLTLPSVWFEMQMTTPTMNVYGATIPGLPFVLIGFNDNIAWSETNVGHDVADWYTIKWQDSTKMAYLLDGKYEKVALRVEEINVKGVGIVRDTVRYTVWGPIVYPNDSTPRRDMAMHWLGNEKPKSNPLLTFSKINKAKNYDDFIEAGQYFDIPAQNFAFASKNGDIALRCQGKYPLKKPQQGRFIQDGTSSANAWGGSVPYAHIPQYKNPTRGFIMSANQHTTDPSYPYYYNTESFEPYRGRLLSRLLTQMDSITLDDMKKLQNNNHSLYAEELTQLLLKNIAPDSLNATEKPIYEALKTWDYIYSAESATPVYFHEWAREFYAMVWDEFNQPNDGNEYLKPADWRAVFLLRDDPKNRFFDLKETADKKEMGGDIALQSFRKLVARIPEITASILAKGIKNPQLTWGSYQDSEIPHIARMPGLGRTHLNLNGCGDAINAISKSHGPSWRMIVELGDTPKALVNYPGGQTGNPGSKRFDAFVDTWAKGDYYEAVFMRKEDEQNARLVGTQVFKKKQ